MNKEIEKLFEDSIVRVLVEVKHFVTDKDGRCLITHVDIIETDSSSVSYAKSFDSEGKSVTVEAKEIRFYGNTKSPISLIHTIKLTNNN